MMITTNIQQLKTTPKSVTIDQIQEREFSISPNSSDDFIYLQAESYFVNGIYNIEVQAVLQHLTYPIQATEAIIIQALPIRDIFYYNKK